MYKTHNTIMIWKTTLKGLDAWTYLPQGPAQRQPDYTQKSSEGG